MRLHRLTVTAFGPFAGTEEVDFDVLSAAGLFLFTGATGAGKTSLLDAVSFALYGQVPGARQQARSLRSDHAAEGVKPKVVLEVTLRDRRLRVTRSPAWDRPKRRGTGTVVENARLLVEEATADGHRPLTTRLDEGGQLLRDLTGLSPAQFCQVALLPQGQFAEFLRADADKRRDLLESLFDTRRFAGVEAWLVTRRQQARRSLDEVDQRLGQVLARVGQASGAPVPDDLDDGTAPGWVEGLLDTARSVRSAGARAARRAAEQAEAATADVSAARHDAGLRERRAGLRARLVALDARQPARDAAVAELEAAREVAPLLPVLAEAGRLQSELEQARALAAADHVPVAPALAPMLAATGTDSPRGASLPPAAAVGTASRAARDEVGTLRGLVAQEAEAAALARQADEVARQAVAAQELAARADAWLAEAGAGRVALAAERDDARAAADGLPAADRAVSVALMRVTAARRRDRLVDDLTGAQDRLRARTDAHQSARGALQLLREARLAGMAAELAAGLRPGTGCPVCGSSDHPRPAMPGTTPATPDDERQATEAADAAESARLTAADAVADVTAELAGARAAAGGDTPVGDLEDEHDAAVAERRRRHDLAAGLQVAERALAAFDQERETWTRDQVRHHERAAEHTAAQADLHLRAAALVAAVGAARGDDSSVQARAERLERLAADLDRLAGRLAEMEHLEARAAAARDRAEAEVSARRFESLDAVAAAARGEDRIAGLEALRHRHDTELHAVRQQLDDPEIVAVAGHQPADEVALLAAATAAVERRDECLAQAAAARDRSDALSGLRDTLADTLAERAPLGREHRTVDALSRLAEGKSIDNSLRMSLSAYVLAARLEQVAACASERLLRMSSGRYSLLHSPEPATGRGRGGLALRVLDAWTGQERDPATLSGGESFAASLSLALGLADVVTSEAGGALLQTLFVDEGFGSLDEETLDDVMGVLDDLRDGGRTVGLVSHVPDLRQRIPVQLRVDKSRRGSVVRQ
jgi:exonuclease SbcC